MLAAPVSSAETVQRHGTMSRTGELQLGGSQGHILAGPQVGSEQCRAGLLYSLRYHADVSLGGADRLGQAQSKARRCAQAPFREPAGRLIRPAWRPMTGDGTVSLGIENSTAPVPSLSPSLAPNLVVESGRDFLVADERPGSEQNSGWLSDSNVESGFGRGPAVTTTDTAISMLYLRGRETWIAHHRQLHGLIQCQIGWNRFILGRHIAGQNRRCHRLEHCERPFLYDRILASVRQGSTHGRPGVLR